LVAVVDVTTVVVAVAVGSVRLDGLALAARGARVERRLDSCGEQRRRGENAWAALARACRSAVTVETITARAAGVRNNCNKTGSSYFCLASLSRHEANTALLAVSEKSGLTLAERQPAYCLQ
jgi:hypothetical protein